MAQFNQLNSSASAITLPPAGYTAVLYDEGSSMRLFDSTGEITPTSSQASWTASFAHEANGFTTGSKRLQGSFTADENLTVSGSAYVSGTVSASQFSGSGADLFGIPASAIEGLDLSKIGSGSVTASVDDVNGFVVISAVSGSTFTGSINLISGSYSGSGAQLYDISASAIIGLNLSRISTGSYTASIDQTGSFNTNADVYVSSSTAARNYQGTASIKTDGGLIVRGDSYFSSSVFIKGDLTILGTQSVEYVTSSHINFGDNILNLNTSDKNLRFGGVAVIDSGSGGNSGSMLWDSVNNQWISDVTVDATQSSAVVLTGPRTSGVGSEVGLTQFSIPVSAGSGSLTSSLITVSSSILTVPLTLTRFSGSVSLTGSLIASNSVVTFHTASLTVNSSSITINSGSIFVNNDYTGSNIFGTASWAMNVVNGGSVVTVSGSYPTSSAGAISGSATGSLWWNTNDGNLYIQVTSPTGSSWVPAVASVAGGVYGATFTNDYATANTWSINHGLGTTTPIVQVYNSSGVVVSPTSITATDSNNLRLLFNTATAGTAKVSTGVGGATSASYALVAGDLVLARTASYANDTAAAAAGVPLYGVYRSGSFVLVRTV